MNLGPTELLILLVLVLLLFGATKLPRLARSLGEAQHEFKRGLTGDGPPGEPPDKGQEGPSRLGG